MTEKDDNQITDFRSLEAGFAKPAAEYTTAPFFVWNAEITKDEITKFLTGFRDAGSSQVFIHPRPGLITEYLSAEWFELFRFAVDKGRELGMKVWIYDENSYPSGFAGGHVPDQMPESYNQGQGLRMTRVSVLPDTASGYFLCLKEGEDGSFTDVTGSLDNETGKTGKYALFSKTYNGKSPWYGGFSYVDLLYPGVTQKFLELTMEGYEKNMADEFGNTIPGIFTDEPQINSPGGIRWTPDLFETFADKWHYDLRTNLPSLFEEVGDWKKVRHNYTQTLLDLFIERWARPYFEYCEEKNLTFTGHYWEHEWPNMRHGGDNMAMYAWHHVPAIDMLFNQWNDERPGAQFGNVRAVRELASAANQTGRQRKLSETYGGSGWELSFTDMKRNGDWEYALGVNFMNQHLTYFSMAGARKYDYPPSFDYHEPWWNNYRYINDHFARLSFALSSGKQKNGILVLEPTTSAWLYDSYARKNPRHAEIGQGFQSFLTTLEKQQVEYDLGSEKIIEQIARVSHKRITVGKASYRTIVIPPMTESLNMHTYRLLERFVAHGGTLIAFSKPSMINGSEHPGLQEFFRKRADRIISPAELSADFIKGHLMNDGIEFNGLSGGDLYHHRRILSDGQLLFLANSSLEKYSSGEVKLKGKGVVEMNTLTGELSNYPFNIKDNELSFRYDLPPAGSLLLFIPDKKPGVYPEKKTEGQLEPLQPTTPLIVRQNEDNAILLDFCDVEQGGEVTTGLHTFNASDMIFKKAGFSRGNPWNTSVQFRRNTVELDRYGDGSGFTATYRFNVTDAFDFSLIRAVVERAYLWEVKINGTEVKPARGEWWLDRSFGVFRIGDLVKTGINEITLRSSPMSVHAEIEPVYILGSFTVKPAEKGWNISPPASSLTAGSWKDQGLPYYSWGITYSHDFNIENADGRFFIDAGKWNGTVADVYVNGKHAGIIAFPPYRAEITGFIEEGVNQVGLKVTGSLKNLLGPHYNKTAPGLTSPGSWRNVKSQPPGNEYQLIDYGLFGDFTVYRSAQ